MPRRSKARTSARKEEIIHACAALYETMSFKAITLKEISEYTSFSRPSIYNYFQTKEEIFLALFQREYELFAAELDALLSGFEKSVLALYLEGLSFSEMARRLGRPVKSVDNAVTRIRSKLSPRLRL